MHLITELSSGGSQTALLNLLKNYDHNKYNLIVVCFYNGNKTTSKAIRNLGIPVIDLGYKNKLRFDKLINLFFILNNYKPTILHTWLFHPNIIGRLYGRIVQTPIIITSRRNINIGSSFRELINRLTASLDHKVIAVCEAARILEIKNSHVHPEKVLTIYNGVDVNKFTPVNDNQRIQLRKQLGYPPDCFIVGSLGRLHPQKGFEYLIEAIATCNEFLKGTLLLIAGSGKLESKLKNQAKKLGISNHIVFLGERADIVSILGVSDVFVSSSLWEGMSNSILEALACGLPVIATNVGGTSEIIKHNINGLLITPCDTKAIADAILDLWNSPQKMKALGLQARKIVMEKFSDQAMTQQVEQLYDNLLSSTIRDKDD